MLKDKHGKWVETLDVTEEVWKNIMQETLNGIVKLLDSAEKLLQNDGDKAICAGLYTYAVEEYGKLLLLKRYSPSGGNVKITYRNEFRSHKAKFEIAIKHLPKECTMLHKGFFDSGFFDPAFFDSDEIADCENRQAVFYSDFADLGTDSGIGVKPVPSVDWDCLEKAVSRLKTVAFGTSIP